MRVGDPRLAGLGQSDQVAGQVAAIHRGDVERLERRQGSGVVPVVEVALAAFHPEQRGQCGFQPFDGAVRADPGEVPRRDARQQIKADVGGRGALGDDRLGLQLEIVRWQRVGVRRHEGIEELPGAPGDTAQRLSLWRRQAQVVGRVGGGATGP